MVSSETTPDSRLFAGLLASDGESSLAPPRSNRQQGLGLESLRIRTFTILGSSTTETLEIARSNQPRPPRLQCDGFSRAAISEQIYKYPWTALCSSSGASSLDCRTSPVENPLRRGNGSSEAVSLNRKTSVQDPEFLPSTGPLLRLPSAPLSKSPRPQETAPPRPSH